MTASTSPTESPAIAAMSPAQRVAIQHTTAAVERRWKGRMSVETIERSMAESLDLILPNASVWTFVPIIVERLTNDRLHALAELGIEPHAATN